MKLNLFQESLKIEKAKNIGAAFVSQDISYGQNQDIHSLSHFQKDNQQIQFAAKNRFTRCSAKKTRFISALIRSHYKKEKRERKSPIINNSRNSKSLRGSQKINVFQIYTKFWQQIKGPSIWYSRRKALLITLIRWFCF